MDTEQDEDEDEDEDSDAPFVETNAAAKKEEAEIGSPPIQPTRTRRYFRGRTKRTIDDDDDESESEFDDGDESSNKDEDELVDEEEEIAGQNAKRCGFSNLTHKVRKSAPPVTADRRGTQRSKRRRRRRGRGPKERWPNVWSDSVAAL